VTIHRSRTSGAICAFRISGHAGFAEAGRDLVCAGVSTVSVGTVNAIEALLHVPLKTKVRNGFLQADVPELADATVRANVQLLLESMLVMLQGIRDAYGDVGQFIQIHERADRS